jgi:hypothetical protein
VAVDQRRGGRKKKNLEGLSAAGTQQISAAFRRPSSPHPRQKAKVHSC